MNRHEFLRGVHEAYQPRNYLEIGINDGRGLRQSRTRTIGVDPSFKITSELACDLKLSKTTSDDFFAREDAISWFREGVIDLTFIDGLHIFEFALRDFMNAERLSSPMSVIVFDDMLPRTVLEAARGRQTVEWTGDVFKVALVLERYRPDLVVVGLDTVPTGLLLVLGADPDSTVLREHYDEILTEFRGEDPQDVPVDILRRSRAADPTQVLASPVWSALVSGRDDMDVHSADLTGVADLRGTAKYVASPPASVPWRAAAAAPPKPLATKTAAKPTTAAPMASVASASTKLIRRARNAIKRRL